MNNMIEVIDVLSQMGATVKSDMGTAVDGLAVLDLDGVTIGVNMTVEAVRRIRFSIDVKELNVEDDGKLCELMYRLLDLNTEIDPVAAAIDSSNPEKPMIVVRTTLRNVDLQAAEIVAEVEGLMQALGEVYEIVK